MELHDDGEVRMIHRLASDGRHSTRGALIKEGGSFPARHCKIGGER